MSVIKPFIRMTETFFDPLIGDCEIDTTQYCELNEVYILPFKRGDVIKWIQEIGAILDNSELSDLKVGIVKDCILVYENIGSIIKGNTQLFVTATIPDNIDLDKCFEFVIYTDYTPVDCSEFSGITFDELDALQTLIGDINCTFDELE